MEIAVLGAGVYLADALFNRSAPQPDLTQNEADQAENMLESHYEFLMHEARENGIIAPQYGNVATRVPWSDGNAPYYMDSLQPEHEDSSIEDMYRRVTNARVHQSSDVMEHLARNRQAFARKAGNAFYSGFTPEMVLVQDGQEVMTSIGPHTWLARNPHDSDYSYAVGMSKAVPRDPMLFTPDSNFATAPGLPFRYSSTT